MSSSKFCMYEVVRSVQLADIEGWSEFMGERTPFKRKAVVVEVLDASMSFKLVNRGVAIKTLMIFGTLVDPVEQGQALANHYRLQDGDALHVVCDAKVESMFRALVDKPDVDYLSLVNYDDDLTRHLTKMEPYRGETLFHQAVWRSGEGDKAAKEAQAHLHILRAIMAGYSDKAALSVIKRGFDAMGDLQDGDDAAQAKRVGAS